MLNWRFRAVIAAITLTTFCLVSLGFVTCCHLMTTRAPSARHGQQTIDSPTNSLSALRTDPASWMIWNDDLQISMRPESNVWGMVANGLFITTNSTGISVRRLEYPTSSN